MLFLCKLNLVWKGKEMFWKSSNLLAPHLSIKTALFLVMKNVFYEYNSLCQSLHRSALPQLTKPCNTTWPYFTEPIKQLQSCSWLSCFQFQFTAKHSLLLFYCYLQAFSLWCASLISLLAMFTFRCDFSLWFSIMTMILKYRLCRAYKA